jgi:hypothetical protein
MKSATSETTKTLADCIRATKCRKGPAVGTTKNGAFWLAAEPIYIRHTGGDGIGNNGADRKYSLELRHYRDDKVRCTVHLEARHENGDWGGAGDWWNTVGPLGDCRTAEEMQVVLLGCKMGDGGEHVYSSSFADEIERLAEMLGPDEEAINA